MAGGTPRLNGIQIFRAIQAAGGLWTMAQVAKAIDRSRMTIWHMAQRDDFPPPVCVVGPNALWAGEDILDWLEGTERYDAAQRFSEAITRLRQRTKFGPRRHNTAHSVAV